MLNFYDAFDQAERIEGLAADLYGVLRKRFEKEHHLHELFVRLEQEERQHALRIRLLSSQVRSAPLLAPLHLDPSALHAALGAVEHALIEVRASRRGLTYEDAANLLVDLEQSLEAAHAQWMAQDAPATVRRLFEALAKQDRAHQQLLEQFRAP